MSSDRSFRNFLFAHSYPFIKIGLGIGLVAVGRKIETSNNPICKGENLLQLLAALSQLTGTIVSIQGMIRAICGY